MKKEIDAVEMMRAIRDRLVKRYSKNPDLEREDLDKIRKKYKMRNETGIRT